MDVVNGPMKYQVAAVFIFGEEKFKLKLTENQNEMWSTTNANFSVNM